MFNGGILIVLEGAVAGSCRLQKTSGGSRGENATRDEATKNRWNKKRAAASSNDNRSSRFDKANHFEQKITINTTFNNTIIPPPNVADQSFTKNESHTESSLNENTVITSPPVLINMASPQIIQNSLVISSTEQTMIVQATSPGLQQNPAILPRPLPTNLVQTQTLAVPPTTTQISGLSRPLTTNVSILPSLELAAPPSALRVQNISDPETLRSLNIPHPDPLQVQNIPTPNPIQLNEIPNPKPLDLMTIPTPSEDKHMSDPEFIKNIPPPNKSVPPPKLTEVSQSLVQSSLLTGQNIACQNVFVHTIPPLPQIQSLQPQTSLNPIPMNLPVGQPSDSRQNNIPSLMDQPILPPPGMSLTSVNVNYPPPPHLSIHDNNLNNQQPIIANQMPPVHIPPPGAALQMINQTNNLANFKDCDTGSPDYEAMASLGRMVAQCGPGVEEVVKQRKTQDPRLWFLFHKESAAYRQYQQLIEQFKREMANTTGNNIHPNMNFHEAQDNKSCLSSEPQSNKRKRKSRWSEDSAIPQESMYLAQGVTTKGSLMISKITKDDPNLIQYVINTYGSTNISDEEWKKAENSYKVNMLYHEMVKKKQELVNLKLQGKNKYEYDSDEEIEGGTWEHKKREKEMMETQVWAQELNRHAEGKHHIGDFLPPEELKKFIEKSNNAYDGRQTNTADYNDMKIKNDNIGFKMLQKLGWTEGTGLGENRSGIVEPISATNNQQNQGLGLNQMDSDDDEYESYRKRMMLAYRFRPNPLNNPRRPYY